jgi:hypothetical protein
MANCRIRIDVVEYVKTNTWTPEDENDPIRAAKKKGLHAFKDNNLF